MDAIKELQHFYLFPMLVEQFKCFKEQKDAKNMT